MNVPGQWIFRVGAIEPESNVDIPDINVNGGWRLFVRFRKFAVSNRNKNRFYIFLLSAMKSLQFYS